MLPRVKLVRVNTRCHKVPLPGGQGLLLKLAGTPFLLPFANICPQSRKAIWKSLTGGTRVCTEPRGKCSLRKTGLPPLWTSRWLLHRPPNLDCCVLLPVPCNNSSLCRPVGGGRGSSGHGQACPCVLGSRAGRPRLSMSLAPR